MQTGAEFHGPVETLDEHHCNDHFAQIYETDDERFAAAVPFVRHGLERDERVMYVLDESSEPAVRTVLRDAGIDVDAALDSGALSFDTVQDTYLREGSFDPDEMVEFYAETVAAATEEYEALRIVAETTWLQDDACTVEQFMEYEAKVNELFADEECLAICQFDRTGFPPEVIRDVVETHPHLIYDGAACHNFYYTPPAEFFGADDPAGEVDRMLGTIRERTEAKTTLTEHRRFLRELNRITASRDLSFEEKLQALFDLGCDRFDLGLGALNRVDPDADRLEVEYVSGDHDHFEPGVELPLSETYCRAAADIKDAACLSDPAEEGFDDVLVYEEFGIPGYLGTYIPVDGGADRTFAFVSTESREASFTEEDRTYLELMGQWVGYELNRRKREEFLRECYEITSDPESSFEEKVEHLLDLGCDRFGLDMAGLHHLPSWDGEFRLENGVGLGGDSDDEPLITDPGDGAYCRQAVAADEPVGVADVRGTDWEDDRIYEELGVTSYLGTTVSGGGTPYGTLWFGSTEPRDRQFSDAERTFIELMGQWVGYELNRRQREEFLRECYQITSDPDVSFEDKLERLLELGREQFGLEMAGLNHLPSWDGEFRLEMGIGLGVDPDEELWTDPGYGCFCRETITADAPVRMSDVRETDWEDDVIHRDFGLTSYLGTKVTSGSTPYGTLWFGSTEPRDRRFSDAERTFIELMGQWVSYELERREHKQSQRELYEIIADNELSTDEKFEQLLELGCDHLDLSVGMLTRNRDEAFEIVKMHGSHPELGEGSLTPPMTDNYCRRVVETGDPVSVADAGAAGWDGDALYHQFDLECYAGVQLTVGGEAYGTICFTDLSPRGVSFTDAEQTFLELMGQCVSYELERNHRETQLQDKNDRLENFASMLAHELRNPVNVGQIYSQQLPAETDVESVDYVREAFDRIENIVDVMLVLTRGREAVDRRSPVGLADTAGEAWAEVDAPEATLEPATDATIRADETYVRHLLRNLLENAVEHGGRDVTVTVGDLPDGFYVADDGTGISGETRNEVFDEGFTTAADSGGTGLGLAFVRRLADVYEWNCAVTESEAGGARFEFTNVDLTA
nr:MEDS domain-containing protein [Halorussus sp. JP-T4]